MMNLIVYKVCLLLGSGAVILAADRPNIIFILADDLGWDDVGFHGSKQIPTPNIDTLAYDGIILNNYYIQPICTPSRSALMTGKHPIHTGMQHSVLVEAQQYGLGLEEKLLPEYLKEVGYSTHMVGKWHLGYYADPYRPTWRGYDTHLGYYQGCGDYYDHSYTNGERTPDKWGLDFWNNTEVLKTCYGQYSTEVFTKRTEEIIAQHDTEKPLFMYLPHQAVHSGNPITPLEAPWKYLKNFDHINSKKRRLFAGMMSALDDSIGNVTRALAARGMLNNTIIAFSTDNGGPAGGFDMNMACNYPLRGVKATLWDGGVRGAGFLWSPLLENHGYVSNDAMQIFDWVPTLLSAAGYDMTKVPSDLDGMDQWGALSKKVGGKRTEMLYNIDPSKKRGIFSKNITLANYAIRVHEWKIIHGSHYGGHWDGWYKPGEIGDEDFSEWDGEVPTEEEIRMSKFFESEIAPDHLFRSDLTDVLAGIGRKAPTPHPVVLNCGEKPANASTNCDLGGHRTCLFNIHKDPCEYHNVADLYPDIVRELQERVELYAKKMVMPRNTGVDPNGYPGKHNGVWAPWIKLENN